ncbi:hypothetical protein BOTBODRAFT_192345 [Botryobasidium botryosum FD-172 SS1]|uniref:NADP-dependent oxidoreductase domain-containing protein n=1 Tax=Botryobasidium botryosum (strain FD-172 SS1) TaxID=930990 RepID=A0A067LYR4_BOTB1|nr:hypothetical protein BOTBODRAFT_192345 [Botryobasidium botryosum FD-172 SS1]
MAYVEQKQQPGKFQSRFELPPPVYADSQTSTGSRCACRARRVEVFRRVAKASIVLVFLYVIAGLSGWTGGSSRIGQSLPWCHKSEAGAIDGEQPGANLARLPTHFVLPSGDAIPAIALGEFHLILHLHLPSPSSHNRTWQASKGEVGNAVKVALQSGYRHIDGAWIYRNEEEVGAAIKESGVPREELWLTSKLWNTFHAPEDIEPKLDETLRRLQTSYLDLYLIHWPIAFFPDEPQKIDYDLTNNPYPTWKKLEELVDKGKIRNIGVSNFNIRRLRNLTDNGLRYKPVINQVELNYFNPQPELVKWSKENGILLEAYSPLGSNKQVGESLNIPEVKGIAKQLGITPAQVLISWQAQRGTVVLPKSVTPSRIEENLQVFRLPTKLYEKLETAATSHKPQRVGDPSKAWGIDIFEDEV